MLSALLLLGVVGLATTIPTTPLDEVTPRDGEKCGYDSCTSASPDVLNVHIVAHTHDDVGWLKTVDQYYYGSRNDIQKAGVKYILDSVVKELWEDPRRKFIYVETAFFWKWWTAQPAATQSRVRTLVRQGRLQFVGGAWSMNDEAASHYQSTIDQFTWGLRKLNDTFGDCGRPRVGWQIDPFGHSREFAAELALMGYDGLFLGRIDYQDKDRRKRDKAMEMVWRGNDDLGESSDIFTGVLYNTYSPPPGFCFDVLCSDEPIIDDVTSPMYNVDKRVTDFLAYVLTESKYYRSNNVIVTMGGDFTYQDAFMWFDNLDKLIKYGNLKAAKDKLNVKLFYSTPACYLKAVKDANPRLPTKQDDFFPYASDSTAFWTGYFTSRPTTKRMERDGNNYLQTFKMMQVLANLPKTNQFVLNELKSAMGVMQHHDAITGTEKQHVTHDYERIMTQALDDAYIVGNQALNKLIKPDVALEYQRCEFNQSQCSVTEDSENFIVTVYNNQGRAKLSTKVNLPVVSAAYSVYDENGNKIYSDLQELSSEYLAIPTRQSNATHNLYFTANCLPALGFKNYFIKKEPSRSRREAKKAKRVNDYYGNINEYWKDVREKIDIDIKNAESDSYVPSLSTDEVIPERDNRLTEEKEFDKNLNWDVLKDGKGSDDEIKKLIKDATRKLAEDSVRSKGEGRKLVFPILNEDEMRMLSDDPMVVQLPEDIVLENEFITLSINKRTGWMNYASNRDGTALTYLAIPGYYIGCVGNNEIPANRSSGAYIFRPNMTAASDLVTFKTFAVINVIKNSIKQEVTLRYDETITVTIGIDGNATYINSVIGNLDEGTEYVLRFQTDLETNGEFYTDSNGRQILKRVRNQRPQWNVTLAEPIPGNYYPVVSEIYIENDDVRVVVNVDRARGGSSLKDGWFEIMQHRRLKHDDAFGVGEALNETAGGLGLYSTDSMILQVVPKSRESLTNAAEVSNAFFSPPQLFVAPTKGLSLNKFKKMNNVYSFLKTELPRGVNLLTVEPWADGKILIRLENYLDSKLSNGITVDLFTLFKTIKVKSVVETTLAANRLLSDYKPWKWNTDSDFFESFNEEFGQVDEAAKEVQDASEVEFINLNVEDFADDEQSAKIVREVSDGLRISLNPKQIRTFIADYKVVTK